MKVQVTGQSVTGSVGEVSTVAKANISVIGVSATGELGNPFVWSLIDETQTPNYSDITDTQTSSFTTIDQTQTPGWEDVA